MTLSGLGFPMIPSTTTNTEAEYRGNPSGSTKCEVMDIPPMLRPFRPPSTLRFRATMGIGGTPQWHEHILKLLSQVPQAVPIKCSSPSDLRIVDFRKSSKTSTSSTRMSSNEIEPKMLKKLGLPVEIQDTDVEKPQQQQQQQQQQPQPIDRKLLESRIKSLRLDIGDLCIAENIERLCDHYFQLNDTNVSDSELGRKLSQLFLQDSGAMAAIVKDVDQEEGCLKKTTFSNARHENLKDDAPTTLASVFHGHLSREETLGLLRKEGHFLVRFVHHCEGYILSFRCNGLRNFRLLQDEHGFYLEDRRKCYGSLEKMVEEGCRTLILEINAGKYLEILTEVAHINKHDSMFWWLSPSCSSNTESGQGTASTGVSPLCGSVFIGSESGCSTPATTGAQSRKASLRPAAAASAGIEESVFLPEQTTSHRPCVVVRFGVLTERRDYYYTTSK